jgi:short-subunit dehydrogenase
VTNRTILITGATDGLGRALAQQLAARGDDVILHGRDRDRLAATAEQISRQLDRPERASRTDATDRSAPTATSCGSPSTIWLDST